MLILIFDLHSPRFHCGKREEFKAEEELLGDALDSTPGGLEANELESDGRGLQRVIRLDIHHNLVFLEAVTGDLGGGMFELVA
jgi:hypothetical protein